MEVYILTALLAVLLGALMDKAKAEDFMRVGVAAFITIFITVFITLLVGLREVGSYGLDSLSNIGAVGLILTPIVVSIISFGIFLLGTMLTKAFLEA